MVAAHSLRKTYGERVAVENVTFSVAPGESVGVLGLNGAGKSTTLRLLLGALAPTSGRAEVDGLDVRGRPREVKTKVGYLPETAPLYDELTPREQLGYFARLRGLPDAAAEAERTLGLAGVAPADRVHPSRELSKGIRQRVGLAHALLGSPPLLILDEPTDGLDPAQRVEVRRLIRSLAGTHTVLLSTHVLPEVQEVCTRVLILHRGQVALELPASAADLERRFLEVTAQ
jgi:ABC-2 type transport system ATP-binding protein